MQFNTQNMSCAVAQMGSCLINEDRAFIDSLVRSISSELEGFIAQAFYDQPPNVISLDEFYDSLVRHDWYYRDSDDYTVRERAREERVRLNSIASAHIDFAKLLDEYEEWSVRKYNSHASNFPLDPPLRPSKCLLIKYSYTAPVKVPKILVECPNGCNTHHIPASQVYDECAACGSRMTEDENF